MTGYDYTRHLCSLSKVSGYVSGEASQGPNLSEVTRGDKARHLYWWGDKQQLQAIFVNVTIGRFLPSGSQHDGLYGTARILSRAWAGTARNQPIGRYVTHCSTMIVNLPF